MPNEDELPRTFRCPLDRNAVQLSDEPLPYDAGGLIACLAARAAEVEELTA
jgi:hypothetical protein